MIELLKRAVVLSSMLLWGTTLAQNYAYLDDANEQPDGPTFTGGYPKVMASETQSDKGTYEQWSKYDLIGAKSGMMYKVAGAQAINPDLEFHYSFHPRAYLGYLSSDPCNIAYGMPFNSTASATQGCSVYAGHWLYQAGTRLSYSINNATTTIRVGDANKLEVGSYVVIYDSPAGSFNNAEHAKVTAINKSVTPHSVTLASRGFKSTARSHPANSIVAVHERGSGGSPENWAYNISTSGPRDSNNKTIAQVMAAWIPQNYDRNSKGQRLNVNVTGVYFDEDGYVLAAKKVDANNDLAVDNGILPNGTNVWGEGLEEFYRQVRAKLPGKRVVGGWKLTRGFRDLNGIQMENWLLAGSEFAVAPTYIGQGGIYSQLHNYTIHNEFHEPSEGYTEALSKVPTKLYPGTVKSGPNPPVPANNANFRLGLGAALLGNGHYGRQNSSIHPDPWYDEYAVDVTPGSPNYGKAIRSNTDDESQIRRHKGWLGKPLGPRKRIYDSSAFGPDKNLLNNGGFESGLNGWMLKNVNAEVTTASKVKGQQSLRINGHTNFALDVGGASVRGPEINLVQGRQYTLVFAARAAEIREIFLKLDWSYQQGIYLVPTQWTRFVYTMTANSSGKFRPIFNLGRDNVETWIDDVYVFEGDPNVFRRDFENGVVIVNATPKSRTVSLGGDFLRIKGTGQDPVNNGARISSVTLPPFDAAILVRPENQSPPPPSSPPDPTGGNVTLGGEVWLDANWNGIEDPEESFYGGGLPVKLLTCDDQLLMQVLTDANGEYRFNGLLPGDYVIATVAPEGYTFSPPFAGDRGDLDSNITQWPGQTYCMTLFSGNQRLAVDIGLVEGGGEGSSNTGSASIGDRVWRDSNGDGIQYANETGLGGVTVRLTNCSGDVQDATVTNSAGNYNFVVSPGTYALQFVKPAGMQISPALQGSSRALDSNLNPSGTSGCFVINDGDDRQWFDVGFVP